MTERDSAGAFRNFEVLPWLLGTLWLSCLPLSELAAASNDEYGARVEQFVQEGPTFITGDTLEQMRRIGRIVTEEAIERESEFNSSEILRFTRLVYEHGLEIVVHNRRDGDTVDRYRVTVSSDRWPIAKGLGIGAAKDAVVSALGPTRCARVDRNATLERCSYVSRLGDEVLFELKHEHVVSVTFSYYWD